MHMSKRLLLGLGFATLIMESVSIPPALAADKVSPLTGGMKLPGLM